MKKSTGLSLFILLLTLAFVIISCKGDDNPLAPYAGSSAMSKITIESNSFKPKVTWLGGYVSVFGVNAGNKAALDSSLIWLVYAPGDNIKFPHEFGQLPQGAEDLTTSFGGTKVDSLSEDNTYTFWVLKDEAWNKISNKSGYIMLDSTLSGSVNRVEDTIKVGPDYHVQSTQLLDVYINISDVSVLGRLADVAVEENMSNFPTVRWTVKEDGVTDSLISAIGLVDGGQFNPNGTVWEVYSIDTTSGEPVYGKNNVIKSPISIGDTFDGTFVFKELLETGLERNKTYYLWIANDLWDGEARLRFASGYTYVTFNTN